MDTLVTATINDAQDAGDPSKISILVPPVNRLDDVNNPPYIGNQRPNYNQYLADPDNSMWSYVSCLSNGCASDGDPQSNGTYWDGWPSLAIDAPASQHRAMGWMAFLYDFSGELYWETTYRLDLAWNSCLPLDPGQPNNSNCLFYEGTNGDGTLFYPGKGDSNPDCPDASDRGCIGGTHDIPLETIRLKRTRDGREDFELLNHLRSLGLEGEATTIVESLFPNMHSVTPDRDGAPFDSARAALVDLLPVGTAAARHCVHVEPRRQQRDLRDGCRWNRSDPPDRQPGSRHQTCMVTRRIEDRVHVEPRRQQRDLRDGCRWNRSDSPDQRPGSR
ncbi:MAG: DUF4091 domain-containing protein [Microthrixaceae bacterium]|nr:DUF4091 domain-containing protein [Microthrixaceae bacterium]